MFSWNCSETLQYLRAHALITGPAVGDINELGLSEGFDSMHNEQRRSAVSYYVYFLVGNVKSSATGSMDGLPPNSSLTTVTSTPESTLARNGRPLTATAAKRAFGPLSESLLDMGHHQWTSALLLRAFYWMTKAHFNISWPNIQLCCISDTYIGLAGQSPLQLSHAGYVFSLFEP